MASAIPDTLAPATIPNDPNTPAYDPYNTGGQQRTQITTINGHTVLVDLNTGKVIQDYGPAPTTGGDNSAQVDGNGVQYIVRNGQAIRLDTGQAYSPAAVAVNPHPGSSTSSSYNTSQSLQDPASIQLQQQQLVQQAQQQQATLAEQIRVNTADIAAKQADLGIQQQNLDFLKKKQAFEETQAAQTNNLALAQDARETQQQAFNQQATVSSLQLNIAQAQYQQSALQAQLTQAVNLANSQGQEDVDKFNATMGFNVAQANAQAKQAKENQLQSLATSVSDAAKDPGDRGALASLLLANRGNGAANTAIGQGVDLRTTDSLAPLESLLRTTNDVKASPDAPYTYAPITYTPVAAPQVAPLDLSRVTIPGVNTPAPTAQTSAAPGSASVSLPAAVQAANTGSSGPNGSAGGTLGVVNGQAVWAPTGSNSTGPTNEDRGGDAPGAILVGERGIELGLPDGKGGMLFMNQKQAKNYGIDLKALSKMRSAQAPRNFDDGGVFGGFGNVQDSDRTLASSFLSNASGLARAGTPFATGNLPAPVYASSPGFSPYVTNLIASLQAISTGLPQDYYTSEAASLAPVGVNSVRGVSRTA